MFSNIKIKWLAIIFIVLLLLVLVVLPKKNNTTNRSFKSDLADFETEDVTAIYIYPKSSGSLITLEKEGDNWKVVTPEGETYPADKNQAENMLTTLNELTAKRLVSREKSAWEQYQVNDSLGTRVQVLTGKKVVADIYVGKFDYQQAQNPNPYSRQQGIMTSYVRLANDKDVYAVDGFLSMTFGRSAQDFRSRKMVQFDRDKATRFSFTTPEGNFNLTKQDSLWLVDGVTADSATMADFLSNIHNVQTGAFVGKEAVLSQNPKYILTIEGTDMPQIKVEAFASDTTNNYALSSSLNQGSYFSGKGGLFDKFFKTKEAFIKGMTDD